MGSTQSTWGEYKMFYSLVLLFLSGFAPEAFAEKVEYRAFAGLDEQIQLSAEVRTAMTQLNRYCGSGSYSYRPSYNSGYSSYRPSYNSGPNLGSLISPIVFGLAAGAGLGIVGNLLGK